MKLIRQLWDWGWSKDGHTWLMHALISLAFGVAGYLFTGDKVGACAFALAYYWGREWAQILIRSGQAGPNVKARDVVKLDDLLDACFPLWLIAMYLALPYGLPLFLPIAAIPLAAIAILKREKKL